MPLSKNAKTALIALAVLAITGASAVALLVRWFFVNGDRIQRDTHAAIDDGRRFGIAHPPSDCVGEAVRRGAACTSVMCRGNTNLFFAQCLQMKDRDEATCAGVPESRFAPAGVSWGLERCRELGQPGNSFCLGTMQAVQSYCHAP